MHQRAVLAGGCFWGMQDLIRKLPGVVSTRVGYTGGDTPNATYRDHGTHAEGPFVPFASSRLGPSQAGDRRKAFDGRDALRQGRAILPEEASDASAG